MVARPGAARATIVSLLGTPSAGEEAGLTTGQTRHRSFVLAGLGIAALGLVAWGVGGTDVGAPPRFTSAGSPGAPRGGLASDLLLVVVGVAAVLVSWNWLSAWIAHRRRMAARGDTPLADTGPPVPLWVRAAAIILPPLLIVAFLVALAYRGDRSPEEERLLQQQLAGEDREPDPRASREVADGRTSDRTIIVLIVAGVVFVASLQAVSRARRHRAGTRAPRERVEGGVRQPPDLDGLQPADAVVTAYAEMAAVLGADGVPYNAPDTPFEYLDRARPRLEPVHADAAALTTLFEEVRYSDHPVDDSMKARAITAVRRVAAHVESQPREPRA